MKVKINQETKQFQPINLTITIENDSELMWFKVLFGLTREEVLHGLSIPGGFSANLADKDVLKDPDATGNILDELEYKG